MNSVKGPCHGERGLAFWIHVLLLVILASLIVSVIILSCVPPVSKDALIHHLTVPKLYLKHGGIYEIPFMPFSYYPMNLDLLFMIPLYFGNDIVPKFIHFSFALLTAWLIFGYLKSRTNAIYALLGAVFFLSIPIIVKLSITAYIDLGVIFFSTASLLLLLKWIESRFRPRFLIISAVFCGLATGTKYNGLVSLFLLTVFVPFLYSRYSQGIKPGFLKAAGYGVLFLFVALVFFSPWMIRDYFWTGNPIFPLYDHWFNPQNAVDRQAIGLFTYRSLVYQETWWQMALLPVRIFFQGQDGSPQYFDGRVNLFLLFLPFFAFYRIGRDPKGIRNEKKILLAFGALFFVFGFFSSDLRIRYVSPMIPPLVILSVLGVKKLSEIVRNFSSPIYKKIGGAGIFLIIFFSLWLNASYILIQYRYVKPFDYLKSPSTRDEYISKYRFEYPAMQYINENLTSDALILFVFLGKRGYYCDMEYVFDMINNKSTLRQLVKSSNTPENILLGLKDTGVTHLLIHYDIFDRWVKRNFTNKDQQLLQAFSTEYVKLLFSKRGYGVFRLENLDL